MNAWVALGLLGAVSYALRSVVVLVVGDRALPASLERFVGRLAPAVLAAMVAGSLANALRSSSGSGWTTPASLARVAAVTAGGVVAVRSGSVGRALAAGLVTFLVLRRLLGG